MRRSLFLLLLLLGCTPQQYGPQLPPCDYPLIQTEHGIVPWPFPVNEPCEP